MKKLSVCVIFDGAEGASDKALRSTEYILRVLDPEKYNIFHEHKLFGTPIFY